MEGDGFLYKMVRIVAGTLVTVGMGLAPAELITAALAAQVDEGSSDKRSSRKLVPKAELRRRGLVGPTLPPERLTLEHIEYDRAHEVATGERFVGPCADW